MELKQDIRYLKGVGPARAEILNKLNIYTIGDAINYFPRTYEDRGKMKKINEMVNGDIIAFRGVAASRVTEFRVRKGMTIYKLMVRDETGSILLTWFNQTYIKGMIEFGKEYVFFGRVSGGAGRLEMQSPIFDEVGQTKNTGKIIPIYPLTNGITQ